MKKKDQQVGPPRNPIVRALCAGMGARGGAHGKSHGALRKAAKQAIAQGQY